MRVGEIAYFGDASGYRVYGDVPRRPGPWVYLGEGFWAPLTTRGGTVRDAIPRSAWAVRPAGKLHRSAVVTDAKIRCTNTTVLMAGVDHGPDPRPRLHEAYLWEIGVYT